ncbi:hypothetical protein QBC36DRAFT_390326 [Triangularia setosa]|uniref:Uncharacterized protein n=1 Tax=Triangularia setosa TaxID=2587417 RepID=A0AAN6VZD5_9PEZI|nr:hypothetical protein QBC36DRAFT_390326 [Podospora setosa]
MKLVTISIFPLLASSQSVGQGTKFTFSAAGRGCPQGSMSVSASMSPSAEIMTFGFDKLHAFIGPGYEVTSKTQNCGIHLNMNLPNSHTQYALAENTYHGYERLDKNITLSLLSTFYSSDNAAQSTTTEVFIGGSGVGQVFTKTVEVPETEYVWSKCGRNSTLWNLNERVSLTSRARNIEGRFDGEDGVPLTRQLRFIYRECS